MPTVPDASGRCWPANVRNRLRCSLDHISAWVAFAWAALRFRLSKEVTQSSSCLLFFREHSAQHGCHCGIHMIAARQGQRRGLQPPQGRRRDSRMKQANSGDLRRLPMDQQPLEYEKGLPCLADCALDGRVPSILQGDLNFQHRHPKHPRQFLALDVQSGGVLWSNCT